MISKKTIRWSLLAASVVSGGITGLYHTEQDDKHIKPHPQSIQKELTARELHNIMWPGYDIVKFHIKADRGITGPGDMPLEGKWIYIWYYYNNDTKKKELTIQAYKNNTLNDTISQTVFDTIKEKMKNKEVPETDQEAQQQIIDVIKELWQETEKWPGVYIFGGLTILLLAWWVFMAIPQKNKKIHTMTTEDLNGSSTEQSPTSEETDNKKSEDDTTATSNDSGTSETSESSDEATEEESKQYYTIETTDARDGSQDFVIRHSNGQVIVEGNTKTDIYSIEKRPNGQRLNVLKNQNANTVTLQQFYLTGWEKPIDPSDPIIYKNNFLRSWFDYKIGELGIHGKDTILHLSYSPEDQDNYKDMFVDNDGNIIEQPPSSDSAQELKSIRLEDEREQIYKVTFWNSILRKSSRALWQIKNGRMDTINKTRYDIKQTWPQLFKDISSLFSKKKSNTKRKS